MGEFVLFLTSTYSLDRLSSFGEGLTHTICSSSRSPLTKQLDCEEGEEEGEELFADEEVICGT